LAVTRPVSGSALSGARPGGDVLAGPGRL